jgi:ankyrin repeat protein
MQVGCANAAHVNALHAACANGHVAVIAELLSHARCGDERAKEGEGGGRHALEGGRGGGHALEGGGGGGHALEGGGGLVLTARDLSKWSVLHHASFHDVC